eukprot:XP_001708754.1 Hypothetical protein GL50803_36676 [Giardia lamblia ATCC 50803]
MASVGECIFAVVKGQFAILVEVLLKSECKVLKKYTDRSS